MRRVVFQELVQIAADHHVPLPLGISTADAMQQCLDRAVSLWYFAMNRVDSLVMVDSELDDPNFTPADVAVGDPVVNSYVEDGFWETEVGPNGARTVVYNRWYRMEKEARLEIEKLAGLMTTLGIAERTVRIEEAKAALMIAAVRDAALAAGISHDQVRELGIQLRAQLASARASLPHSKNTASTAQSGSVSTQVASLGPDN